MSRYIDLDQIEFLQVDGNKEFNDGVDCCVNRLLKVEPIKAVPLDKIKKARAQIIDEKDFAYADFERYKVECLGQDWEDAYDSLPQDDFRYGMERCLEILDKLIESEE